MSDTPGAREHAAASLPDDLMTAARAAYAKKAADVVVLDMRAIPSFTDFFLICTAQNQRQIRAVADAVEEALRAAGSRPAHVEGNERSEWILLDYFNIVVHVFTPEQRRFYGLERLWGSAARIPVADLPA
jgi:ribosome-associated protein